MAFHISCPLTCRRICDCDLGFPAALRGAEAKERFWGEIEAVAEFLEDSWTVRERDDVAQVFVPRVARASAVAAVDAEDGEGAGDEFKLSAIQQKAMTATLELEDYVRRLETGGAAAAAASGEATTDIAGEEQGLSTVKIICRICLSGESEGTEKAIKMLPCKTCGKKYHKSCLKSWAANRDLFNWNSWSCPSCRLCEVCRRTGDPNKLMYCKRCDGAYHCYCQQPPHKNVGHGPYLCPKHTRCHSCDSAVPGSGPSTRWFLAHTCCDACGRLFVKGNYCPVCLKVYRDSEITPMVCCDLCERWVHCHCDGISDEKYQEFQSDQNLEYRCAACRGDCYQIIDMDDAVRELWKRKDITERDLIANLRATAGLPALEDTSYPNGENNSLVIRKSDNIPLKFSVKGLGDNLLKNCSEMGKNVTNKKLAKKGCKFKIVGKTEESYQDTEKQDEVKPPEASLLDHNVDDMKSGSDGPEIFNFSTAESLHSNGTKSCFDQNISKQASRDPISIVPKVKIKRSKLQDLPAGVSSSVHANKNKLVIHLGTRNANASGSPKSETSSCQRDHEVAAFYGSEDTGQQKPKDNEERLVENWSRLSKHDQDKGVKNNITNQIRSPKSEAKERAVTKFAKHSNKHPKEKGNMVDESEINATCSSPQRPSKKNYEILRTPETENMKISKKLLLNSQDLSANESKPSLKLKFKNPYIEQRSSWASQGEEENSVKGQRSKRKRPDANKVGSWQDFGVTQLSQENPMEETLDANWILKKLGKDAIGKRVEVQLSDSSWYPGAVADINHKTSSMSVSLDNGRSQVVELGKQVIRFIRQKHKRTKL